MVADPDSPVDRYVLVNHVDEWLDLEGRSLPLSTNLYEGAVYPEGTVSA
ncbi:MAG: glycogen debranching enzyme N-terminal domain-containing protein [Nitrospiraceae bacterium]